MAEILWLAYLGIILGVLARTWLPYWVKKMKAEGITLTFDWRYVISAMAALLAAFMTAQPLMADFALPGTATSALLAFWAGFLYGGGWNAILNAFLLDYKAPQ